jgi:tripartite ATP-independent transporter DctP family solute receptor
MRRIIRPLLAILFVGLFLVSLAAAGSTEPEKIKMKIYTAYPSGDESYVTAMEFAKRVATYSNSTITAEVFHSGTMGGEKETVQAVKLGDAQGVTTGLLPVTMFTQDYGFFDGIYVFKNFDHFQATWNGKPGEGIKKILLDNNLRTAGVYMRGMRNLSANKPIRTPADAKGLKLRTPQDPAMVMTYQAIGFLPTPIALPELFTALQTGVVDCAEGPPSQMLSYKYQEVQKYLMMTGHNVSVAMFNLSERFLQGLSAERRAIVEKAAKEAVIAGGEYAKKADKEKLDKLIQGGMTQIEPDRAAFMAAARPAVEELFRTKWKVTNWNEIMSYAK